MASCFYWTMSGVMHFVLRARYTLVFEMELSCSLLNSVKLRGDVGVHMGVIFGPHER